MRRLLLPLALMAGIPSATAGDLPALKPGDDLLDQPQHLRMLVTSNQLLIERTADGALQYTCFCGPQVALSEIPVHVRNALIAIEDRRFRIHNGIDP
ncbi:MAG: transglycosylase domain-containing protein, partial [Alphaproteobacteria bacterium]|nr:transglycosylase domain-containing protein [Alphaproteobacteria bacterium]